MLVPSMSKEDYECCIPSMGNDKDQESRSFIKLKLSTSSDQAKERLNRKRKRLSLQDKAEVIRISESEKVSIRDLANRFGVGRTQITEILKNKLEILKTWSRNNNKLCKRAFPKTKGLIVDSVVYDWFCHARTYDIPVSGPLIREKALQVAKEIGFTEFKASCGWLDKFRARHNISFKRERGVATLDEYAVTEWKRQLKSFCDGYSEADIYNCDEMDLVISGSFINKATVNHEPSDGVATTEKISILLCVNMKGHFEKPLLVGKELQSHSLMESDLSNFNWRTNENGWLSKEIMSEWLEEFNEKMAKEQRKVLLFLYQSVTRSNMQFSHVKLEFIPSNLPTVCQPLDQGIFEFFKLQYHLKLTDSFCNSGHNNNSNVIKAVDAISTVMHMFAPEMIRKCFVKAGFGEKVDSSRSDLEEILHTIADNSDEYMETASISDDGDRLIYVTEVNLIESEESTGDYSNYRKSSVIEDSGNYDKHSTDGERKSSANECVPVPPPVKVESISESISSNNNNCQVVSMKDDAEYALRKLMQYFSYIRDDQGLKLVSEVKSHLESSGK